MKYVFQRLDFPGAQPNDLFKKSCLFTFINRFQSTKVRSNPRVYIYFETTNTPNHRKLGNSSERGIDSRFILTFWMSSCFEKKWQGNWAFNYESPWFNGKMLKLWDDLTVLLNFEYFKSYRKTLKFVVHSFIEKIGRKSIESPCVRLAIVKSSR